MNFKQLDYKGRDSHSKVKPIEREDTNNIKKIHKFLHAFSYVPNYNVNTSYIRSWKKFSNTADTCYQRKQTLHFRIGQ